VGPEQAWDLALLHLSFIISVGAVKSVSQVILPVYSSIPCTVAIVNGVHTQV
jgi:hypothetical protein